MPRHRRNTVIFILLLCAAVASVGIWLTGSSSKAVSRRQRRGAAAAPAVELVDQRPLQTAQQLDKLATTRDEGRSSHDALNLADHEVDLAFTTAMREAQARPPQDTPETQALRDKISTLKQEIAASEKEVASLQAEQKLVKDPSSLAPQLQLAQSELALHQDELQDTKLDLARAGGDPATRIQWLYNQHEAIAHQEQNKSPFWSRPEFLLPKTLAAQVRLWFELNAKRSQIEDARQEALDRSSHIAEAHQTLEQEVAAAPSAAMSGGAADQLPLAPMSPSGRLKLLNRAVDNRKTLGEYDQRTQDLQHLAQVYEDWATLESSQMTATLHAALIGLLAILVIAFGVVLGVRGVEKLAERMQADRRRVATMRLLGRFAVQGIGLILVIIVILGPPSELSTLLALAGAGLTVALKDFIVAFFGWFVLMRRNGIRVGDWVEINGILGEVVEISLLHTVLLETGNWNEPGHPTGRRVTFVNSFAIEGHYFNFSTSGQWLWDALEFSVPEGTDPYPIRDGVLEIIRKETQGTARQAEEEWRRSSQAYGGRPISGEPVVDVRPAATGGTTIIVRYITSAHERHGLRGKLYEEVVELLRGRAARVGD